MTGPKIKPLPDSKVRWHSSRYCRHGDARAVERIPIKRDLLSRWTILDSKPGASKVECEGLYDKRPIVIWVPHNLFEIDGEDFYIDAGFAQRNELKVK